MVINSRGSNRQQIAAEVINKTKWAARAWDEMLTFPIPKKDGLDVYNIGCLRSCFSLINLLLQPMLACCYNNQSVSQFVIVKLCFAECYLNVELIPK